MQAEEGIEEYQLSTVKIDDLIFDKSNPNRPSKEVIEGIRKSILEFGLIKPLVINEKMEIADGEHRALVWKALGKTEIQAYIVPKLNDDIKRRLARQTLNKLQGEHDIKLDADEMALIFQAGQLDNLAELIAQERESLENILSKHKGIEFQHEDNFDVDKALEDLVPETQLGDIWQLGQHRIICADCTDKRSIDRLLEDKKVDLLLTDPPYGVAYNDKNDWLNEIKHGTHVQVDIENDSIGDYREFFASFLKVVPFADYNIGYIFMSGQELHNLRLALDDTDMKWGDYLIWVKQHLVLGRKDYNAQHEFIVYCWKNRHKFYGDTSTTVLNYDKPQVSKLHPIMKPIPLLSRLITDGSATEMTVFDPFLGSGSTMIACEQTNRVCIGVEIDPHYVDVCVKRYEAYTGNKAKKVSSPSEQEAAVI